MSHGLAARMAWCGRHRPAPAGGRQPHRPIPGPDDLSPAASAAETGRLSGVAGGFDGRPPPLDLVENVLPAVLPAGLGRGFEAEMADELLGERHPAARAGVIVSL